MAEAIKSNKNQSSIRNKKKGREKMTKAELQLAVIKKKETDKKALRIVEQMLETNVDFNWLLENLKDINKCHMEDVIEERAIAKLCGYVLCDNPLRVILKQRYFISVKENKVYDITKRKNFCSSHCYGAANYLLEQMLTSPLWMRDKEIIPTFEFLKPEQLSTKKYGDEVDVGNVDRINLNKENESQEIKNNTKESKHLNQQLPINDIDREKTDLSNLNNTQLDKENFAEKKKQTLSDEQLIDSINQSSRNEINVGNLEYLNSGENASQEDINKINEQTVFVEDSFKHNNSQISPIDEKIESSTNIISNIEGFCQKNYLYENEIVENSDTDQIYQRVFESDIEQDRNNSLKRPLSEVVHDINKFSYLNVEQIQKKSHETNSKNVERIECKKKIKKPHIQEECGLSIPRKKEILIDSINIADKIEKIVDEWVTESTFQLMFGGNSERQIVIDKILKQHKYHILCKKLNQLQFEDEQEDKIILENSKLKPTPNYEVLKEEGKKLKIKVKAFYAGKTEYEMAETGDKEEEECIEKPVIPILEAHAPNYLRRKIFLDKLNRIVPDLLHTITGNQTLNRMPYSCTSEKLSSLKTLVNSFSLNAKNIVFKTTEWTLIGLIMIKMLSVLDPAIKKIFETAQTKTYVSMILMSYKLEPNYLDLLILSIIHKFEFKNTL